MSLAVDVPEDMPIVEAIFKKKRGLSLKNCGIYGGNVFIGD